MGDIFAQIRLAAERDARERPLASGPDDVPWSAEAITLDWLDGCVGSGSGRVKVEGFELGSGSAGTSVRRGIRVRYAGADDAVPMFAKTCPGFEHRIANVLTETAQAEGRFYLEIRPALSIETPKGYFWAADPATFRSIILIEDIATTKGASFCDWRTPISRGEAEDMVTLLAGFHGRYHGDAALADAFPWLKPFRGWAAALMTMEGEHLKAMDEAREVLPQGLRHRGSDIFAAFKRCVDLNASMPETLLHSDVHLGNWYKTGAGRMGLCDWQCCSRGGWARDFAYAISTSLAVEDRRRWERDLLSRYLGEMARLTGAAFPFETGMMAYRQHLPAALLMWTPTLCPAPNFPAMQPRPMSLTMIERISTAMDDLDSLAALAE